jgi:hypothetical protein
MGAPLMPCEAPKNPALVDVGCVGVLPSSKRRNGAHNLFEQKMLYIVNGRNVLSLDLNLNIYTWRGVWCAVCKQGVKIKVFHFKTRSVKLGGSEMVVGYWSSIVRLSNPL